MTGSAGLLVGPVVPTSSALRPVPLTAARLTGGFWGRRQAVNSTATLSHCLAWMKREGWTGNFTAAPADRRGREFTDSEIYKLTEALCWDSVRADHTAEIDRLAGLVAGAQAEDGYLSTAYGRRRGALRRHRGTRAVQRDRHRGGRRRAQLLLRQHVAPTDADRGRAHGPSTVEIRWSATGALVRGVVLLPNVGRLLAALETYLVTENDNGVQLHQYADLDVTAGRLGLSVRTYYPDHGAVTVTVTNDDYKKLLYWNSWAQYVGGNTQWPDANEFWADWNGSAITYRSWIHHNIFGSSNWTVIEDVMGLRPRNDAQIELSPINIGWTHFAANNIRYRGADLSVVWDDPADGVTRYSGVPQGYAVFVNGTRAFTVDRLTRVVYNPATGPLSLPAGGTATFSTAISGMRAPAQVVQNSPRMVDMFAKAGTDLTSTLPNYASGASTAASYTASGTAGANAVDGYPINEPLWGTYQSLNATDWLELNFGQARTVEDLRLYFRNDRATNRYRQPSSYNIQYWNGSAFVNAASQVKSPSAPRANYNLVRFGSVSTQRIRVQVTHASGFKTGLTEVQAYGRPR